MKTDAHPPEAPDEAPPPSDDSWVDALIAGAGSLGLDDEALELVRRDGPCNKTAGQPRAGLIRGALDALR